MKRELGKNFERLMKLAAEAESAEGGTGVLLEGAGLELVESGDVSIDWPRALLGQSSGSASPRGPDLLNRFTPDSAEPKAA